MYLKKITIKDHVEMFDENDKLILIADENRAFRRAIRVLFQLSQSSVWDVLHFMGYEAVAYGHTIEQKVDGSYKYRLSKGTLREKMIIEDVTIAPQKLELPLPIRNYARADIYNGFYDLFFGQLSFFRNEERNDYYSFAEEIWYDDGWTEYRYGLGKGAWKKATRAVKKFIEQGRWTVPDYCKHPRVAALLDFFEGNALMKASCDAIGKECPPMFITDALADMKEVEVAVVMKMAKESGRQVFFIESKYKADWLRPYFDVFLCYKEE